jgi:beta-lactam-binding protein with PASTA domain
VRLVIAGAVRRDNTVTMPSLVGLRYDEVVEVLDRLGLRVGKTETLTNS